MMKIFSKVVPPSYSHKIIPLLIILFIFGIVISCSAENKPDINDVKDVKIFLSSTSEGSLENALKEGIVRIHSINKTNGQDLERFGVKIYTITYEIELEYLKTNQAITIKSNVGSGGCVVFGGEVGEVKKSSGPSCEVTFQMTENGWRGPDKNIY